MKTVSLSVICVLLVSFARGKLECPRCDTAACVSPVNCLSGLVKDNCDCCYVCGATEGNRCYMENIPGYNIYNKCGKDLECKLRDDNEKGDLPEAICYCTKDEPVCGTDGKIYRNHCEFTEARYIHRTLQQGSWESCQYAPMIVTQPTDVQEKVGKNVAFSCEAIGWPIPKIEWQFVPATEQSFNLLSLPSDDTHYSVQTNGGPNSKEVTSWLQILAVNASNQGTYHCMAVNENGRVSASAKLTVLY